MHRLASRRRSLLTLISGAYPVTMVALWLAETLVAERHWLTTLATYAPQQIYGLPLPFLVLASLIRRNRRALALNLAALLILVFGLMGFILPLRLPSRSQGTSLRVMTYNIHHGAAGIAAVARVIRDHRPDIVCLQEANACEPWEDPMPELVRLLPGWRATSHPRELAVLSQYPIVGERFAQRSACQPGPGAILPDKRLVGIPGWRLDRTRIAAPGDCSRIQERAHGNDANRSFPAGPRPGALRLITRTLST